MFTPCEIRLSPPDVTATDGRTHNAELTLIGERTFPVRPLHINRRRLLRLEADAVAHGRALGEMLFAEEALGPDFHDAVNAVRARGENLRVRLRLDAPALRELHWERLHYPRSSSGQIEWLPLSSAPATPFSRYLTTDQFDLPRPVVASPLRLLLVVANPTNLDEYGLDPINPDELNALRQALNELAQRFNIEIDALISGGEHPPTLDNLRAALNADCHLVHFLCHGARTDAGTTLYLERDDGTVQPVLAAEIVDALRGLAVAPTLCFLAACESAKTEAGDAWVALGPELVTRGGLRAVIAMTERVGQTTAQRLTAHFYENLLRHGTVDLALNQARRAVQGQWDWSVPVLFMRTPDGQLFDVAEREDGTSPAPGESPYQGMQYFDVADADRFFGRERLTAELVQRMGDMTNARNDNASLNFLVIIGASGSGKSSLVRAGVVAALQRGEPLVDGRRPPTGSAQWPVHLIVPTARPLESLAASLTRSSESVTATSTLVDDLRRDPRSLHLYARRLLNGASGQRLLLVVDQFEELFTLCRDRETRRAFVNNLLTAAATDGVTTVLLTLRADFYHHCAEIDALREAVEQQQRYIGAMSEDELRRAIEEPAARDGWTFEPGLVDHLLREVNDEPGALPLLSHALLETWKHRRGRMLTFAGYHETGGVRGAIAQTAETVYTQRLTSEQQVIAKNIFLRLTELGEGSQDTRRRVALDELLPQGEGEHSAVEAVLTTLADARLLTTDRDITSGQEEVEVAHEALIREWPTLREWLDADREGLRIHRQLSEGAREWEQLNQDSGALYRGTRLTQALEWRRAHKADLNALEQDFLSISEAEEHREIEEEQAHQRERERQQRERAEAAERLAAERGRRIRLVRGGLAIVAVLLVVVGGMALQAQRAEAEAKGQWLVSEGRRLFDDIENETDLDDQAKPYAPLLGIQLAVEGMIIAPNEVLENELAEHVVTLTETGRMLNLSGRVAAAPTGEHFVIYRGNSAPALWQTENGTITIGLPKNIDHVSWSPNGNYFVALYQDKPGDLWRVTNETVEPIAEIAGLEIPIYWSPNGDYLFTADSNQNARLWHMTGSSIESLMAFTNTAHLHWAHDNSYFATYAKDDSSNKVWRITDSAPEIIQERTDKGLWLHYSSDGGYYVVDSEGSSELWRVDKDNSEMIAKLTDTMSRADISPDGGYFRIWYGGMQELRRVNDGALIDQIDTIGQGIPMVFAKEAVWSSSDDYYIIRDYEQNSIEFRQLEVKDAGTVLMLDNIDGLALQRHLEFLDLNYFVPYMGDHVLDGKFLNDDYFAPLYSNRPSQLQKLRGGSVETIAELSATAYQIFWSPDSSAYVVSYQNAPSELRWLTDKNMPIVDLGRGLSNAHFTEDESKLLLEYDDNRVYLISLEWILSLGPNPASLTSVELLKQLCAGPVTSPLIKRVENKFLTYLNGREPVSCR